MNEIFKSGQQTWLESSAQTCEILDLLGGGGQGEVYASKVKDRTFALKWYYPTAATPTQRKTIEALVRAGPPTEKFLWPLEMVSCEGVAGFGYLMPLREKRFHGLIELMNGDLDPPFRSLVETGMHLSNSFLQLHSKGLCYCDISFGNLFFDPEDGDVSICDNDNVGIDGQHYSGVLGTPRFMAPEVVIGRAKPSTTTDLYSLAVMLFYIFMMHHPLEGKREAEVECLDFPAMQKLYGHDPVFIFDPENDCNRPVPGLHDNAPIFWQLYPSFFQNLFVRAFTDGMRDPQHGRVRESEWRTCFQHMRDLFFYCPNCGAENFFDDPVNATETPQRVCWGCKTNLSAPLRIRIGSHSVVLTAETHLYPHHIDPTRRNDFSSPVAALAQHPKNPDVWGIKNLSGRPWTSVTVDGRSHEVPHGRSVSLAMGTRIIFGSSDGLILF
jgi:serine/threonine protein kinase